MAVHEYRAEMVANVLTVLVQPGQSVVSGDTLIMLESMKMEIPIFADADGIVAEVPVRPADVVQEGDILAVVNQ
jgi:hypothetical protein